MKILYSATKRRCSDIDRKGRTLTTELTQSQPRKEKTMNYKRITAIFTSVVLLITASFSYQILHSARPVSTSGSILFGDVNCNDRVNSVDAALILQFNVRLILSLPCENAADVNQDNRISAVDAALILQFDAGIINMLGPVKPTPTHIPTIVPTSTPTPTPTNTATSTPTNTPAPTPTLTSTPTPVPTQVPTPTVEVGREQGYAVGFFRDGQSPITGICPTLAQIREDIELMANNQLANTIRLYGQGCNQDSVPSIAKEYDLRVYTASWCGENSAANENEIKILIQVTNENSNVTANIVCSEAVLRNDLTAQQVINNINTVKSQVSVPVTTAETWNVWQNNPELAAAVDFMLVHIHPYHDNQCPENGAEWVLNRINLLKDLYPGKKIVVGEAGWPTGGTAIGCVVPSVANQETFLTEFLEMAEVNDIPFFFFELFDEEWKIVEGPQGPTWGTYYSDRTPKHSVPSIWLQ